MWWCRIIKEVELFGQNGSIGYSNIYGHTVEIVTANMMGPPVKEKPKSLESINNSVALHADRVQGSRTGLCGTPERA